MTHESTLGYEAFVAALGAESGDARLTSLLHQLSASADAGAQHSVQEYRSQGVTLAFEEREISESKRVIYTVDALVAVHLHAAGHQGHTAFPGPLPAGLTFADTRAQVRAKLGVPAESAAPHLEPSWDRYDHPDHTLRVQYAENRIELIALTVADARYKP